jgi:XTP/dITP diphosphohydrolase
MSFNMAATDWLSEGTLVLASNNKGKIAEFEKLFAELQLPVEVVAQGKLNIEDAIEDGLSFVENAIIKARHAAKISGKPAIADDSGICVPVLGGVPGIYSARYAGEHGNDTANNEKLLADLKPLRQDGEAIEGMFVCVLALVQHAEDPLPQVFQAMNCKAVCWLMQPRDYLLRHWRRHYQMPQAAIPHSVNTLLGANLI